VDEFKQAQQEVSKPGTPGWWEIVLPVLTGEQLQALEVAAADRTISHRAIATVITRWGHKVTEQQVGHWRRTHVG
jgi:hypothetical protein